MIVGKIDTRSEQSTGIVCPCQAEINGKTRSGSKSGLSLTQVPGHQIGIVEILHAQSNDVNEFLYDLHELHSSRVDLNKINENTKRHFQFQHCLHGFTNAAVGGYHRRARSVEHEMKPGKESKQNSMQTYSKQTMDKSRNSIVKTSCKEHENQKLNIVYLPTFDS